MRQLGVQTEEVNKDNFAKFGLRDVRGVAVEKVVDNSPAAAAGLRPGDVIVKVNGDEVSSTRKLTRLISEIDPDHQARLTVMRGGSEKEMTATLAARPAPKFGDGNFSPFPLTGSLGTPGLPDMPDVPLAGRAPRVFMSPDGEGRNFTWRAGEGRQIGVSVMPLTKQLGEHFGSGQGLMVSSVRENSPAAKAGIKAGDIIVEVDGKPLKGEFDLIRVINVKKEGDIQLTVMRDRGRLTLNVTPEVSKDSGFVFQTGDDDGVAPPVGFLRQALPAAEPMGTLPAPAAPPAVTVLRPGRVL